MTEQLNFLVSAPLILAIIGGFIWIGELKNRIVAIRGDLDTIKTKLDKCSNCIDRLALDNAMTRTSENIEERLRIMATELEKNAKKIDAMMLIIQSNSERMTRLETLIEMINKK